MHTTRPTAFFRSLRSLAAAAVVATSFALPTRASEILYGTGGGPFLSAIYGVDTTTGEATLVWDLPWLYLYAGGLAYDPATDDFYAIGGKVSDPGTSRLYRIGRTTGIITEFPGMSPTLGFSGGGLALHPTTGVLYATGLDGYQSSGLYTIDKNTGVPTFIGHSGGQCCVAPFGFNMNGLGFRADGTLFANGFTLSVPDSHLFTIDLATGLATDIGPHGVLLGRQLAYSDLAFRADGQLFSMGSITGATNGLYTVDPLTGHASLVGNLIAPLGCDGGLVFVGERAPTTYCTAKTNSLGCVPKIRVTGTASFGDASPLIVDTRDVLNKKNGLLFYGLSGPAAIPFLGGTLCAQPPVRRTPVQKAGGALPPVLDCSGTYTFDFDAWYASGLDPAFTLGKVVGAQFWSRDIQSSSGVGLTDAVQFFITP
ncbi:MAG: hypothetical protein K8S98_04730 [Planctomycetes bacterium]|nr:hypothetical protein [Planctomycetota bacterium]